MTIKNQKIIREPDWDFFDHAIGLEKVWRRTLSRFTDKQLLHTFPAVKTIIPKKIAEWQEQRNKVFEVIKNKLTLIKSRTNNEFQKWFWREWVKVTNSKKLLGIDNHISRLKILLMMVKGHRPKGQVTEEQIQQALSVPIECVIDGHIQLRKSGNNLVGLCPFHEEKHPSFYIYTHSNSFYCFSCLQGGNTINLVRLLHDYSFKEAVEYLTKI